MTFKECDLQSALFLYLQTGALQGERVCAHTIRFRHVVWSCVPASAGADWVTSPLGRVVIVINGWLYHL